MLLFVNRRDLCLYNVADTQDILGLFNAMIRNLADMNQAVHAGQNLCKGAEAHQLHNLDLGCITDGIAAGEHGPGVGIRIFVTEGDLSLLTVKVDDVDINLITDGNDLRGLVNTAPAQLGDMNHAVYAANIDKSAVTGQGLYNTMILLADFHLVPELLNTLTALRLGNAADGTDNTFPGTVDLGDAQTHVFVKELGKLGLTGQIGLAGRDKHADAGYVHHNAALVLFGHSTFENCIALNGFFHIGPCLGGIEAALGEHRRAFHVVNTNNDCFDRITDLNGILDLHSGFGEFRCRDKSGVLGTQINTDFRPGDRHDGSAYLLAIIYGLQGLFQHFIEAELLFCRGSFCRNFFCDRFFCRYFCCFSNRRFRYRCLFLDFFDSDFVTHFVYYLLNDPRRR